MNIRLVLLVTVPVSLIGPAPVFGWGENGHRITAEIAERNLDPHTRRVVREILGEEHMAEIATWPDDIRSDKSWDFAKPWHFYSIDDGVSFEDNEISPKGDVVQKLRDFESFLRDPDAKTMQVGGKTINKREALAFYVHFVGDIHQPLHVGRRADRGGNKILVEWFGDEVNLHSVWDEHLIESTHLSYTEFSTFLNRVSDEDKESWQRTDYLDWAEESIAFRDEVYDFGEPKEPRYLNIPPAPGPPVLSYDYRSKSLPIIRDRLQKGGVRLAGKLNEIFAGY